MTVPPRGVRSRRSGRRPGWLLLSALLVLAILASSTLVFTNRVELLRLAVILSLWAAVLAAFVSVTYRRQSQLDEARARDMKFVYDLQLDREISARREYELSVEAHLRRQLGHELRAQAADEMAALRSELVSLRSHLEALLGADLGDRPALESDRVAEPLSMPMPPPPGRVESSRVTEVITEEVTTRVEVVEEVVERGGLRWARPVASCTTAPGGMRGASPESTSTTASHSCSCADWMHRPLRQAADHAAPGTVRSPDRGDSLLHLGQPGDDWRRRAVDLSGGRAWL